MSNNSVREHNDTLTADEIREITKVHKGAQNGLIRQMNVLNRAGIHYWLGDDGSIVTTWTHVHNAKPHTQLSGNSAPNFATVK